MSGMTKKFFGLGKGLGSLIPETIGDDVNAKRENVFYVEVSKIQPNPDQPRTDFDQEALVELSRSIRKYGVLQPLLVSKVEEDLPRGRSVAYQLIAGERRWRAAQMAGLPQVPVIIRDDLAPKTEAGKSTRLEVALIENIQRADLNAIETGEAYSRLANDFGMTHDEIAEKVGKSRVAVTNALRLLKLPKYIKDAIRVGQIPGTMGRALLSFKDEAAQRKAFDAALAGGITTRDMEGVASSSREVTGPRRVKPDARYEALMQNLQDHLQVPVMIRLAGKRLDTGQVMIRFTNQEELNEIVKRIID